MKETGCSEGIYFVWGTIETIAQYSAEFLGLCADENMKACFLLCACDWMIFLVSEHENTVYE